MPAYRSQSAAVETYKGADGQLVRQLGKAALMLGSGQRIGPAEA